MAAKTDMIVQDGTVIEALPNTTFRVRMGDDSEVLAMLSGKLRRFFIKIMPGDRVKMEFSQHDKSRGRIIYRY